MAGYTPEFYEDPNGSEPVLTWLRGLASYKRRAATAAIEHVLARQGPGVCRTGWGKWISGVDGGIFELRIRHDFGTILRTAGVPVTAQVASDAAERHSDVLLRVFCHAYGDRIVLLLAAYDKGEEPSPRRQSKEAKIAEKRLREWKRRQLDEEKRARRRGGGSSRPRR